MARWGEIQTQRIQGIENLRLLQLIIYMKGKLFCARPYGFLCKV